MVGYSCHIRYQSCARCFNHWRENHKKHVTLSGYFKGPDKDVSVSMESFEQVIELSKDLAPKLLEDSEESEKVVKLGYRGYVMLEILSLGRY